MQTPPDIYPTEELASKNLILMSLISFVIYVVLAVLIFYYFHEGGMAEAFEHGYSFMEQIGIGGVAGCMAAAIIMFVSNRRPVAGVLNDFTIFRAIKQIQFTPFDRIQISFFAGFGEELLFRGAIQPLLGIWITSLIFIGIHGYFKFKSFGHVIFGVMMFGLSVLLGYLFEYTGLIAAMMAHAVYDVIMLWWVKDAAK